MTISIVTASFNQGSFIEETIASVITQAGDFRIDYLIFDGASKDDSVRIIRKYDDLLKSGRFPIACRGIAYRWISRPDRGQCDAINQGLRAARGDVVAWLNSDDTYYPGALAAASEYFRRDRSAEVVFGRANYVDERGRFVRSADVRYGNNLDDLLAYWQMRQAIIQPAVFFKRSLLEAYGYLDEGLYVALDYDLWLRFARGGVRFHFLDRDLATYREHGASKTGKDFRAQRREQLKVSRRYWGFPLSGRCLRMTVRYLRYLMAETGGEFYWRGGDCWAAGRYPAAVAYGLCALLLSPRNGRRLLAKLLPPHNGTTS